MAGVSRRELLRSFGALALVGLGGERAAAREGMEHVPPGWDYPVALPFARRVRELAPDSLAVAVEIVEIEAFEKPL